MSLPIRISMAKNIHMRVNITIRFVQQYIVFVLLIPRFNHCRYTTFCCVVAFTTTHPIGFNNDSQ